MEDCIFCKIIKGEVPSYKIYENDYIIAILDIFPANEGHVLIIPKEHYENIFDIGEKDFLEIMKSARRLAMIYSEYDGLNLLQNNKEQAGQVVKHFHLHLIPRRKGDESRVIMKWTPVKLNEEDFKKIEEEMKNYVIENKIFND